MLLKKKEKKSYLCERELLTCKRFPEKEIKLNHLDPHLI